MSGSTWIPLKLQFHHLMLTGKVNMFGVQQQSTRVSFLPAAAVLFLFSAQLPVQQPNPIKPHLPKAPRAAEASHLLSLMKYRKFMRNHSIINWHIIKPALSYLLWQSRAAWKAQSPLQTDLVHLTEKTTLDLHKPLILPVFLLADYSSIAMHLNN